MAITTNDGEVSHEVGQNGILLTNLIENDRTDNSSENVPAITHYAQQLQGWRLITVEACLDSSIVSTALVTIGSGFDDFVDTVWIVLAYLLAYMAFAIFWAKISDHFGRKPCILAAWTIFIGFSVACGVASSLRQLIAFRTLQGLGGCGLYSLGNVVMPEITPSKYFATTTSAQGVIFAVAAVLGPTLGGVISSRTTWRWIFYLNVPVGCIAALVLLFTWTISPEKQDHPRPSAGLIAQLRLFDYQSVMLVAAASTLLTVGLQSSGSSMVAWDSPLTITVLSVSAACIILLVLWTWYRQRVAGKTNVQPLFPWSLLHIRQVSISFILTILAGYQLFVAIVVIPERYQIVNENSPLMAGVRLISLLLASACGSTLNGVLSFRQGFTFYSLLACNCLILLGSGLLSSLSYRHDIQTAIYPFQFVLGFGIGATISGTTIMAAINSNFEHYALTAGIVNQCRILGGIIGLAINTIIVNVRFGKDISSVLTSDQLHALRLSLNTVQELSPQGRDAVRRSFALAFRDQFRICMYVAVCSVVLSAAAYSPHPVDLKKRLEVGEKVANGTILPRDGDKLVRL